MTSMSYGINGSSFYDLCNQGRVFAAYGIVTAPVIYTTAAGTGGPLLWNDTAGSTEVNAVILAVSAGFTVASGAASVLGLTGNSGQTTAPTSTTAIDAVQCMKVGANTGPTCNVYRVGTPSSAGNFFLPTHTLDTGAITTVGVLPGWVNIAGGVIVPPNSWVSLAAALTATTAVVRAGLLWAEIPI